ncbi:hypothetical protein G6O67_007556 [Ophiocordyceps sinensis]|uniref:Uncharacterized protein n=1 Tax=Ophiocordyceps sinensis TaxID=72228 RepID=A0A8H4PNX5_9HYPO|nr:hypothetical protein G6O67_007556 [Ophiocordyceps sinensis]
MLGTYPPVTRWIDAGKENRQVAVAMVSREGRVLRKSRLPAHSMLNSILTMSTRSAQSCDVNLRDRQPFLREASFHVVLRAFPATLYRHLLPKPQQLPLPRPQRSKGLTAR